MRQRIENPDTLYLVAEEIDPNGGGCSRNEDIDDAAADGEVARIVHPIGPQISQRLEGVYECLRRHGFPDLCSGVTGADRGRSRNTLNERVHGRQHDLRSGRAVVAHHLPGQPNQGGHPRAAQRRTRRHPIIGEAVPSRDGDDLDLRPEERQRIAQTFDTHIVTGHMKDGRPVDDSVRQDPRVKALRSPGNEDAAGSGKVQIEGGHEDSGRGAEDADENFNEDGTG